MIRNLKALGLALVAVFAMSAMAAAGAQANTGAHFDVGAGTVKLDTSADGHQVYVLDGKTVTCTIVDGTAAVTGGTQPTEVTSNTDVNYTNCHTTSFGLSFPTTVTQEKDCHYTFTAGTWITASNDATGSVHICGATIDVYTNSTTHAENKMRCQIHVSPQEVTGLTYTNVTATGKMAVTIDVNAEVTSTVTDFNTLGCNNHVHGEATYAGNVWVKGTNVDEEPSDVTVMGT